MSHNEEGPVRRQNSIIPERKISDLRRLSKRNPSFESNQIMSKLSEYHSASPNINNSFSGGNAQHRDNSYKRLERIMSRSQNSGSKSSLLPRANSPSYIIEEELLLKERNKLDRWRTVKENRQKIVQDAIEDYRRQIVKEKDRQKFLLLDKEFNEKEMRTKRRQMENRRLQTMEGIIYSKNDDERWRLKKQRKYNRQLLTRIQTKELKEKEKSEEEYKRFMNKYDFQIEKNQINTKKINKEVTNKLKQFEYRFKESEKLAYQKNQEKIRAASIEKERVDKAQEKYNQNFDSGFDDRFAKLQAKYSRIVKFQREKDRKIFTKIKNQKEELKWQTEMRAHKLYDLQIIEKQRKREIMKKQKEKLRNMEQVMKELNDEKLRKSEERKFKLDQKQLKLNKLKYQQELERKEIIDKHMKIDKHLEQLNTVKEKIKQIRTENSNEIRTEGQISIQNPFDYLPPKLMKDRLSPGQKQKKRRKNIEISPDPTTKQSPNISPQGSPPRSPTNKQINFGN